ncbi:peptidase M16 [Planctomycetales bacterium]|nr:peptidase M16 [Planctomycetales bacterium]GHS97992.1 peptidase M16 [Planctomycetales bacterium]
MPSPQIPFAVGDRSHGFVIRQISPALDERAVAVECRHEKSGARLLHLHAADAENLFAVAFATPPPDDTGLPHILEHTVLCGSEKFPVKDPFVELLKTSLATFLNAMTYPDKTVYPCASLNHRDFFNLARVYADAVFHPRLTPEHFAQEGYHYEWTAGGDLTVKGVVYNEMKGAYADMDGVIAREEAARLFDNAYGRDYGGDPRRIPQLTYEQFRAFHARYYHPSNARIFLYGDIPTAEHLRFLDEEYLASYDRLDVDATIAPLQKWDAPRRATVKYPASAADGGAVTLTWATGLLTDAPRALTLNILDEYLLGHSGSPLRRALIDSHLGGELTASGFAPHQRDTYFSVGLKGAPSDRATAVESLILATLRAEVERGLDREQIAAAFLQYEMAALEIKSAYPLRLMELVYQAWLYGDAPTANLRLRDQLAALRQRYETEPRYFENLLQEALLDNPHRLRLVAEPDANYNADRDAEFRAAMAQRAATLTADARENINAAAQKIDRLQSAPNSPAALATLPRLSLAEVNPQPLEFPTTREEIGRGFLHNDIFTNGVNYLSLSIDLNDLDGEELRYLPVYALALTKMGADGLDHAALSGEEAACCGGVGASVEISGRVDGAQHAAPRLHLSVKALNRHLAAALAVVDKRWFKLDLADAGRWRDVLQQEWLNARDAVVESGHLFAMSYAARSLSPAAYWSEQTRGISYLRLIAHLAENFAPEKIAPVMMRLQNKITRGARLTASVAGEQTALLRDWFTEKVAQLGDAPVRGGKWSATTPTDTEKYVGVELPCEVAFVATAMPTAAGNDEDAAALRLLATNLSYGYLWEEVRAKRGAYGCGAQFAPLLGYYALRSYRDPCVGETLATYRGVANYVLNAMDLSAAALPQAIIGAVKSSDQPLRPGYVVGGALARELSGSTPAERQLARTRLLNLTADAVRRAAAKHLSPYLDAAPVAALSCREKLAATGGLKIEALI